MPIESEEKVVVHNNEEEVVDNFEVEVPKPLHEDGEVLIDDEEQGGL